jgi:hypothetical protein
MRAVRIHSPEAFMRTLSRLAGRTRWPRLAALALAMLIAAPIASAGWLSPNTNNNAQDDFGSPIYTSDCSDTTVDDYLEIKNAWITNDGTNLYYKLEACGTTTGYTNIRYAGGLDCNNDGDVDDPYIDGPDGDRKAVYLPGADQVYLVDGKNNNIIQLQGNQFSERIGSTAVFEWQMPLQYIYPNCRASAYSIKMGLGTALISGGRPVTKDMTPEYDRLMPIDYGDAINPDPTATPPTCTQYPTRINCDGARHGTEGALKLGALIDSDNGGVHTANADGDDLANLADEDGAFPTEGVDWVKGGQGSLTATVAGGSGYLNCWIDWNNDKDWTDTGEKVVDNSPVSAGDNARTFTVSNSAANFPTAFIARCRLAPSSGQGSSVTGPVEFGEVEDHRWAFGATGNRPAAPNIEADVVNSTDLQLTWTNIASNEGYLVLSSANPYFLPGDAGVTTTPDGGSPFDVPGVVGGDVANVFYAAQGQVTSSDPDLVSGLSNRVGLFEFALEKGGL